MPDATREPGGCGDTPGDISRRRKWLLLGAAAVCLALLLLWLFVWRPSARLNRLLPAVGLSRLPSSARDLRVERQGRFLGAHTLYARFEASAEDMACFVDSSPMVIGNEPTSMAAIAFGPRCPTWMTWERAVEGRVYHGGTDGASVWLMVDDEAHIVYVGVFEFRPAWLRRFVD